MRPGEIPAEALQRFFGPRVDFDFSEEEVFNETAPKQFRSHRGEETEYHICVMTSETMRNAEFPHNGVKFLWADDAPALNLNECTREILKAYGIE
jgi:hypothetical protein